MSDNGYNNYDDKDVVVVKQDWMNQNYTMAENATKTDNDTMPMYQYLNGGDDYIMKEDKNETIEEGGKSNFCSQFDKEVGGFWCDKATDAACEYWPELEKFLC
jgi:hypothetical protein